MTAPTLVVISPHSAATPGLPNRPASLISAFVESRAFADVVVVNRQRPASFVRSARGGRAIVAGGLVATFRRTPSRIRLVEHPWPFGVLERRFLRGFLGAEAARAGGGVVVWVADPKSITAVAPAPTGRPSWRVVVDVYDAWDRSPLVRGDRRRRAVTDGYRAAATGADLVFSNTRAMRERLVELGARDVRLLPNACPSIDRPLTAPSDPTGLVYVGRIHERFDAALAMAVARALPDSIITIAGPVEREPAGWSALTACPNIRLLGRLDPPLAWQLISGAAALLVPHVVDDYTRSQDAMKAWDAIAFGTAVISTAIPPADGWPPGIAEVCRDRDTFVAAARRAAAGGLQDGRADRLAFAAENGWGDRAATAIRAIDGFGDVDPDAGRIAR
ncbi:MAG TPA: hypothetical protein VGQ31_01445 [Candidatus Limnocylindrales bacterium]|jgi:glycosyltransferase involved in cell wall biosynthesis|nr:hypothetical protein [Candidatus Limnocylindrales bacterium]